MSAAGIIFSSVQDANVGELTRLRTMASIPFGGRYRLIDFALSNMVNAGITKVGVITDYNYQSLLDHIGNGKDWDLARRTGGIKILPPFITAYDNAAAGRVYSTRLEALMGVMSFIDRSTEDVLVLSDCDVICNVDIGAVMQLHEARAADLTLIVATVDTAVQPLDRYAILPVADEMGRLTDIRGYGGEQGRVCISANVLLVNRTYLKRALLEAAARGQKSLYKDVIAKNLARDKFYVHAYDGFLGRINSLESYFGCSMRLLDPANRVNLFYRREQPIFTKVRNSVPTRYVDTAGAPGSLIADGCVIEGVVESSILFRGVRIGRGTVVKNSILMQDTVVGDAARLSCVITDKNVVVRDGRELCGHESMPFYIGKGMMV